MSGFKPSRFIICVAVENDNEEFVALYQTLTEAFILLPERTWSYILTDPIAPADPSIVDMLRREGFLIPKEMDETVLFENWKQQHVQDFNNLYSSVLVTRQCNNRCTYCIIDPEAGIMSPETARAMDRFYIDIIRDKKPETVSDSYLGGEPLLNTDIILNSAERRFYYCQGRGIPYGFSIITNGTLIQRDVVSHLKSVGLTDVRVSMAGPALIHNRLRPLKNGGKTYDLILRNLMDISDLVPVTIECQYDSESQNFLNIPKMLDDMADRRIIVANVAFTPILPRRENNRYASGIGDPNIFLYLKREAAERGFPMDEIPPTNTCMTDFRSQMVFDTDGAIIPCPSVQGGEMAYGNVFEGIDFVSESQLLKRHMPEKCLEGCEILPICMGGCRLQALVRQKDFNGVDCQYETYRLFLEDYIRSQVSLVTHELEDKMLDKIA